MNESESSLRLKILRFPLIAAVIFIHNQSKTINSQGEINLHQQSYEVYDFIVRLISQELSRTAVPIFFMISGYLFFINFQMNKNGYFEKIKSRAKSLLIPFILWNIATFLLIEIAQSWPTTATFFSNKSPQINQMNLIEQIKFILGIDRFPVSYQFWFIRDLIILTLITPIIYWLPKSSKSLLIIALLICWIFEAWPIETPSIEAATFYSTGCFLGIRKKNIFAITPPKKTLPILALIYLSTISINALTSEITTSSLSHKLGVILGIILILKSTEYAVNTEFLKTHLINLSDASFFVFAMHEPTLTITRKLFQRIFDNPSEIVSIGLYIFTPILTAAVATSTYFILRAKLPKFTSIISGGR